MISQLIIGELSLTVNKPISSKFLCIKCRRGDEYEESATSEISSGGDYEEDTESEYGENQCNN